MNPHDAAMAQYMDKEARFSKKELSKMFGVTMYQLKYALSRHVYSVILEDKTRSYFFARRKQYSTFKRKKASV